jgi:hypothetical protein
MREANIESDPHQGMGLPGEGHNTLGRSKVDISKHLRMHRKEIRALAREWTYDNDDADEAEQVIHVVMWKRHESGAYDHHRPNPHRPGEYVSLLGYVRPYIRGIALEQIKALRAEYPYGVTEELNELQEIAEDQGRDRLRLDRLYDDPIPGLKTPLEGTLSADDQELAEKLMANLTPEEIAVLSALVGPGESGASSVYRTEREAARSLDMPRSTYRYKLRKARARAKALAPSHSWVRLSSHLGS